MKFTRHLLLLVKGFNPDAYRESCEELRVKEAFDHFFLSFGLLFALMLLLLAFSLAGAGGALEEKAAAFDVLKIGGNYSASAPVTLLQNPDVVVDLTENASYDGETLLLTKKELYWRFLVPKTRSWSDVRDLSGTESGTFTLALLFLAPAIAFWAGLFFLVKYVFLVALFTLFSYAVPRALRHVLSFDQAFKVSLFAVTVLMVLELLLFPWLRFGWWSLLVPLPWLGLGIALTGKRLYAKHKSRGG